MAHEILDSACVIRCSVISTLSGAILICIFFVQHNFENAYAKNTKNSDVVYGAILGTSNLDIPNWQS